MTNLDAVEGLDAVTRSLAGRTPEQLAALLTRHAEPLARRPAPTELRGLAHALWSYETLHHLVLHLDHPRLQVLATTALISQERAARAAPGPAAPAPGADYQSLMAHRLSFAHLATEPVPPEDVFAALGATSPGPPRTAAETALRHLYDDGLAAPTGDGSIVVPPRAPQLLAAHDLGPFLADAPRPAPDDTATPTTPAAAVPPTSLHDESRAAAATLAATVERLLTALATQPAALRKSGGLAVREIKRLAKSAGATEAHTRLLLDLTLAADLIALTRSPSGITALPTGAYDDWLGRPPGARLAPLLAAWSALWDIPTHTPFGETPTALVRGHDRHAPALRHALLAALADVPLGAGAPLPPLPFSEPAKPPEQETAAPTPWEGLLRAADWHRPLAVTHQPMAGERAAHTLHEAAFLGLVAHGTLTPLGRALLADPRSLDEPLADLLPPLLEQAHFQADLTAVVPGRPAAPLAGLLAAAADRESEGHAVTWRFTPTPYAARWTRATTPKSSSRTSPTPPRPAPCRSRSATSSRTPPAPMAGCGSCPPPAASAPTTKPSSKSWPPTGHCATSGCAPSPRPSWSAAARRPPPWTPCAPRAMRRPWNPTPAPRPSNASPRTAPRPPPRPAIRTHRSPSPTASWASRRSPRRPRRTVMPDPLPGSDRGAVRSAAA